MLIKELEHQATVLSDGQLQIRVATVIMEDSRPLSTTFHRYVIDVGGDLSNECDMVKDIAKGVFTKKRIKARIKAKELFIKQLKAGDK